MTTNKAVVVFESMFGNTEKLSREVGDGLASDGWQVVLADVRHVRPEDLAGCRLLVLGAPTHAFTLSRPSTRADAVRQGAPESRAELGVREWLTSLDVLFPVVGARPSVAVFDTRADRAQHWPGSAARKTARVLRSHGFPVLDRPVSFYVKDVKGPLVDGERERARAWSQHLLELLRAETARSA
ncbi:flavodoxin family protein [Nocardioides panaciterrulae]|uniref:NAD(P)-dependent dehydrogenase (Short-subunit alcohol dehydrogenase family) n=1 Tax=Nocardioides panaciterrulae TaxID=661492 RepID=A0A7Y9J9Z5_9ACTN|nr:flavodoxin domain-containing protein [Nocardioides panaciterrulae]NYD41185.1 NAD(P)-dependent dehydrogenase (short-subunit alcohol dehydrogenase family) [Nocardioides panaciterrulae]